MNILKTIELHTNWENCMTCDYISIKLLKEKQAKLI